MEITKLILAVGAYCCRLESVKDLAEKKPMTALVTMRCYYHQTYSFEVPYGGARKDSVEKDESVLRGRIVREIIEHMTQEPLIDPQTRGTD